MENSKNNSTSESDKRMMGSFESYDDKKNKKKKKDKNESPRLPQGIFETDSNEHEKEDKPKAHKGLLDLFHEKEEQPEVQRDDYEGTKHEEGEIPKDIEQLDTEESLRAVTDYVESRQSELAESSTDDPLEVAADEADKIFLEKLKDFTKRSDSIEAALKDAAEIVAEEFGVEAEEQDEVASIDTEFEIDNEAEQGEPIEDDSQAVDRTQAATGGSNNNSRSSSTSQASNSSNSVPQPPLPPRTNNRGSGQPAHPTPPTGSGAGGSAANFPPSPNAAPISPNNIYPRRRGGDLLVGGILGYLIGRRRGRIKTEARLEPVQRKLEKQVNELHQSIAIKEAGVRKLATEKNRVKAREAGIEILDTGQPQQATEDREKRETATLKSEKPELSNFESTVFLPTANRKTTPINGADTKLEVKPESNIERKPEQMSESELVEIAKNIRTETGNAEQLYQRGKLTKEGLRRVVGEYIKGGRVEIILAAEIIGEEKVRERAIELDKGGNPGIGGVNSESKEREERMHKIGSLLPTFNEHAAISKSANSSLDEITEFKNVDQSNHNEETQAKRPSTTIIVIVGIVIAISIITLLI